MSEARSGYRGRSIAATVLLVAGLCLWALSRLVSDSEHHAYSAGDAPAGFHVTKGDQYQLSVRGGATTLDDRGQQVSGAHCQWSSADSAAQLLEITAQSDPTKPTNVVATFTAPTTGRIRIECDGWGPVYVDDADGAPGDPSGWLLVLAVVALTPGVGLGLSAVRSAWQVRSAAAADGGNDEGEDEEFQAVFRGPGAGGRDDELGAGDRSS